METVNLIRRPTPDEQQLPLPLFDPNKNCLTCKHGRIHQSVYCRHPQRPEGSSLVVRWAAGCPQHERKEDLQ
jgi:hypothetical protein